MQDFTKPERHPDTDSVILAKAGIQTSSERNRPQISQITPIYSSANLIPDPRSPFSSYLAPPFRPIRGAAEDSRIFDGATEAFVVNRGTLFRGQDDGPYSYPEGDNS